MTDSIHAQVTTNLETVLKTIKKNGGYKTDVALVEQMRTFPKFEPGTIIIQELPLNVNGDYDHTGDYTYKYILAYFGFENDDPPADPRPKQERNVAADIIRCIMQDRTRGGVALNTNVEDAGPGLFSDSDGNLVPCTMVQISVQTIENANNPYEFG